MIRRALVIAVCLSGTSLAVGSAFAADVNTTPTGNHSICVGTASSPDSFDGVCVWVPTN